ncbi:hypothetical protein [Candidatus Leptofilum sp.]|uniref:hypothetical protein n=1 Tax=Candidatus Leptofilum sp. TaxID=3241576 RepID=UPI003B5AE6DC
MSYFISSSRLIEEEKLACIQTAVPELHITNSGDVVEYVLSEGDTALIPSSWQEFNLSMEWGPNELSASCQQFLYNDSSVESIWQSDVGEIQTSKRWEADYFLSSSSLTFDRIVVTMLVDGLTLTNAFVLNFSDTPTNNGCLISAPIRSVDNPSPGDTVFLVPEIDNNVFGWTFDWQSDPPILLETDTFSPRLIVPSNLTQIEVSLKVTNSEGCASAL